MSEREQLLRDALQGSRAPDEQAAEDRAWRVVAAASATGARPPVVGRRHRWRAVQVALTIALIALVVSPGRGLGPPLGRRPYRRTGRAARQAGPLVPAR